VLGFAAVLTCTHVWGEPGRDKSGGIVKPADAPLPSNKADEAFAQDSASSRFSDHTLFTYQADKGGPLLAALKLQPKVEAAPRPLDVLVLIEDAASMAQGPMVAAQKTAEALAGSLGADDRMALWTISNKANDLSRGFKPCGKGGATPPLQDAFKDLAKDYPSGAVDLKKGLTDVLDSFQDDPARQRVILFFGDGKSLANPLDENERGALCDSMAGHEIAFFAVPMGTHGDPANLHGFVSGTGGAVVRYFAGSKPETVAKRLKDAFAQPILYPTAFQTPAGAGDVLPTRLPPLRGDAPTLVLCKLAPGIAKFDYGVTGKAGGRDVRFTASEAVPAPEADNFFLVNIAAQWREQKDRPAILAADRELAFAAEQHELAREDLLAKAYWALDEDQLAPAAKLFKQASELDPGCQEARAGMELVQQIRDGKMSKEQLFQQLKRERKANGKDHALRDDDDRADLRGLLARADLAKLEIVKAAALPAADGDLAPPGGGKDVLKDAEARQAVADQQATQLVDEAVRRANRKVLAKPGEAIQDLKQTLDDVRNNPDVSEAKRISLVNQLQGASQTVDRTGRRVQAEQEQAQATAALAAAKSINLAQDELVQRQTRERMRQFADLMHLAREESAYLQAQSIREDLTAQGQPVPVSVTAGYQVALVGYNLRELNELKRQRNENFLAVLLSVEQSAIPFPDEPPIRFPDSSYIKRVTKLRYGAAGSQFDNWKEFSEYRLNVKRYGSSTFGSPDEIGRALEFQKKLNARIDYELPIQTTLGKALDELLNRQDIPFTVNEAAFVHAMQDKDIIKKTDVDKIDPEKQVTRATVLKQLLSKVAASDSKGVATYLIRPDSVEITTTEAAVAEKVVRVYPVADLVTPIGNQLPAGGIFGVIGQPNNLGGSALGALQQGALGAAGAAGVAGGALGALGGGALGALGGIGGLGALGGIGGLGALGGLGGGLGALGGQIQGGFGQGGFGQGGFAGQQGQQGQQLGGGQLNGLLQLQQATQLTDLIKQVVGNYSDWQKPIDPATGKPVDPMADGDPDPLKTYNDIGYYGPAQALVVKAPTRIHTRASDPLSFGSVGPAAGAMRDDPDHKVFVAGAGGERHRDPKVTAALDPKVIWEDALAKGVEDPGLIIACSDFLAQSGNWDHAAEFLKADLRQGVVVRPWVYKALAIALRQSAGASDEIERAETAAAELEPLDAQGYLDASRAMAADKHWERALAFCKEAAALEPSTPYAYNEALLYADMAKDDGAMEWAAGHLLRQDWPVSNKELQDNAVQKTKSLARTLEQDNHKAEAQHLLDTVEGQRQRDLVIKASWQGEADLDLKVKEPTGSVCWVLNKQTIGGGAMAGDAQSDPNSETYQAAQGFSGDYEVTLDRAWGRPLSDKVQLTIIRYQGTKNERQELLTLDLKDHPVVRVNLGDGRRSEAAYVPPPSTVRPVDEAVAPTSSRVALMNQLRKMSEPDAQGVTVGFRGSSAGIGTMVAAPPPPSVPSSGDRVVSESRLSSFIANTMEVTSQTVLAADRRSMRVSMTPVFNTATDATPIVASPGIPGAAQP